MIVKQDVFSTNLVGIAKFTEMQMCTVSLGVKVIILCAARDDDVCSSTQLGGEGKQDSQISQKYDYNAQQRCLDMKSLFIYTIVSNTLCSAMQNTILEIVCKFVKKIPCTVSLSKQLTEYWFVYFCIKSSNNISKLAFYLHLISALN